MRNKKILSLLLAFSLLMSFCVFAFAEGDDALPFENSAFFEYGDYSVHYRHIPAEGAEKANLLLIHGFLSSTNFFTELAGEFSAAGYNCYLIDLPNFGYSTRETAEIEPVSREILIAEFLKYAEPGETWVVAGHSMGGSAAASVATYYPELVESLLLYAPVGNVFAGGKSLKPFAPVLGAIMNGVYSISILGVEKVTFIRQLVNLFVGYPKNFDLSETLEPIKIKNSGLGLVYMAVNTNLVDFEITKQLDMPVFLCIGGNDHLAPGNPLENSLPPQTVTVNMPAWTHMFPNLFPQELAAMSIDFLEN